MRAVIQRVLRATVRVDDRIAGAIQRGFVVLLGVRKEDTQADADYLVDKVINLRVFPDVKDKMNCSIADIAGSLLVVSQFTVYASTARGRRPSFDRAAAPEQARALYEYFIQAARARGIHVETGVFQAAMEVELVNQGPVTILCDSEKAL